MKICTDNVCVRCGKKRIKGKTWKEKTQGATIFHTAWSCPDLKCQKIVDDLFAAQKLKRAGIEQARQDRAEASKLARQIHRKVK